MEFKKTTATKKIKYLRHPTRKNDDGTPYVPKKIHIVQGGTSASKTISILMFLIMLAQKDTTPTLTSVVAESVPHIKRGSLRDFKNIMIAQGYFKEDSWNATDSIYTFENKSQIEFFSSDNGDKLRGARRDRLFINEANNVTFDAFDQLEVRTKEFVFLDYNPTNSFWAFSEIMDIDPKTGASFRNDWDLIILTYKDNEALSQNIVDSIEQRKNRKGWWRVYGEGQLGEVEGKIYKDWAIISEVPHEARLERYGIDFGYSNDPTAIVAIYYLNGGYIVDEILYKKEMTNKQIADTLLNYPQALTVADSAEPKSIAELAQYGINIIGAEKGKDSVVNNIQLVQDERMSLTRNSVHLKKEYDNFLWRTDKDGKILNIPEHEFKHGMDAVAYAMASIKRPQTNSVYIHRPKSAGFKRY